ncbi:putative transcriptional regulator [Roseibium sp. TrichSKD4]|uniref:hypothetical protein n=1 Tax=Roseibium sp. TrichSKD4 TaxID=744980 RepID=UPI0001E5632D|nr:hypothetical protein [Roseibium sp. TrichSKD4]EFO33885.1 putative transcriptional regulator [Roseibium sp. TrichSKD4]
MNLLVSFVTKLLADLVRGLVLDWKQDRLIRQNTVLKAQLKSRKAISRARQTSDRRALGDIRNRLRQRTNRPK